MAKRIRLTLQAQEDVLDIWDYVAHENMLAADQLIDRIHEAFETLAHHSEIGLRLDQIRHDLRCYPVGRYVVFYVPQVDTLDIYRVLHGSRNYDELL